MITRAPCAAAISAVPSVEPPSTTSTSVTSAEGISSSTRAIEPASLYVGMTTVTRMRPELSEAPARVTMDEDAVHTPCAPRMRGRKAERNYDRHRQLPDPGAAELRDPERKQERAGREGDDACRGAGQQQQAQPELGRRLDRGDDPCVPRHHGHDRLPGTRRVTVLQVIVDDALVPGGRIRPLAEVLEEDPDEHRAERDSHDRQRALLATRSDRVRCFHGSSPRFRPPVTATLEGCSARTSGSCGGNPGCKGYAVSGSMSSARTPPSAIACGQE